MRKGFVTDFRAPLELREAKGAVTMPHPTDEQKEREEQQVRWLEVVLASAGHLAKRNSQMLGDPPSRTEADVATQWASSNASDLRHVAGLVDHSSVEQKQLPAQ